MKVDEKVLKEIQADAVALRSAQRLAMLADLGHKVRVNQELVKMGLDPKKTYNISDDGTIKLVEEKEVEKTEVKENESSE